MVDQTLEPTTTNFETQIKSYEEIQKVVDTFELKQLLENIEWEEQRLEGKSESLEPTLFCKDTNQLLQNKLNAYRSLKTAFLQRYQLKKAVETKRNFVLTPILQLVQEQEKVKQAIYLLKQTQLLQNELETLKQNFDNQDLEACFLNSYQFLKLNPKQILESPLNHYLEGETPTLFEEIRLQLVTYLERQLDLDLGKALDALHKFPLVGEEQLGLNYCLHHFSNTFQRSVQELVKQKGLGSGEILAKGLELAIQTTYQLLHLLNQAYLPTWKLNHILPYIQNIHQSLLGYLAQFKLDTELDRKLNYIHNSFYKNLKGGKGEELSLQECDYVLNGLASLSQKLILFELKLNQMFKDRLEMEKLTLPKDLWVSFQSILEAYPLIEKYYVDKSIEKASALDEFEVGNFNSSLTDFTFFLMKKCLFRSLTTCHPLTFNLSIKIYLDQLKPLQTRYSGLVLTQLGSETKLKLVTLNDALATSTYLAKLVEEMSVALHKLIKGDRFGLPTQRQFLDGLNQLQPMVKGFNSIYQEGLDQLMGWVVAPKIEAFFLQLHNETSYDLNPSSPEGFPPIPSPIATKLPTRFSLFLQPFQDTLNEIGYPQLLDKIIHNVAQHLYQLIVHPDRKFTALGIQRLELDVSTTAHYFTELLDSDCQLDGFEPCMEMVQLLQCESKQEFQLFLQEKLEQGVEEEKVAVFNRLFRNRVDLNFEL